MSANEDVDHETAIASKPAPTKDRVHLKTGIARTLPVFYMEEHEHLEQYIAQRRFVPHHVQLPSSL
ncbi:hypothetical protein [Pseudomonas batumici]|uniref:hypothetical protein n=1 Tax=Pseudomonas batumici TaxID=226910 RepID=UPI0012EE2534|nr:hypothetical protein [Pseudomonas batumici]